ncbi:MAG: DUF2341 domain-containing protein [Patescibacteria group bacterium]|jgi:hypothetical protein
MSLFVKRISDIIKKSNKKKRTPASKFFYKLLLLPLICVYSVVHAFYLLFLSPYHSFNFEAKQHKNGTYKHSYHEHLKKKRGFRAYTIALGLGIISLIYIVDLSAVAFYRTPWLTKEAQAAGVTWDGGGDGSSWSDPLNWSGDAVPTDADDVEIDAASASVNIGLAETTPTAHFLMNDDAANTTVVEAIAAKNGTAQQNTSSLSTAAKINDGLTFNGSSDYITVDSTYAIPTGDFTYATWVYLDAATDEMLFRAGNSGEWWVDEFYVYINGSGKVVVMLDNTSIMTSTTAVSAGEWTHLAVTRQGGTVKVYKNGTVDATTGTSYATLNFGTCSMLIGVNSDNSCSGSLGNYTDGTMDDIRIYNKSLAKTEIANIYNSASGTETSTLVSRDTTINSLVVGGTNASTLNFDYDALTDGALIIDSGDLTVESNGTITHTAGAQGVVATVNIDVQTGDSDIIGSINVNNKGYAGGYGTGAGSGGGSGYCGGGSYGGEGGEGIYYAGGNVYGSITSPDDLGSGGGYWAIDRTNSGGGAVKLNVAGTLTVSGSISANGNAVSADHNAAGSGGSVYLDVATLAGAGSITANGGTSKHTNYADGGGGRIAIYYNDTNSITPTAYGGYNSSSIRFGGSGTVYTKDHDDASDDGTLTINNNSHDYTRYSGSYGKTPLTPSGTHLDLTLDYLTVSNDGHLDLNSDTDITLTDGGLTWTGGNIADNGGGVINTLSTGAVVVPSGSYYYANTTRSVTSLTVNGIMSNWNNSNTEAYKINYTTTGAVTVESGAEINVNGKGYAGGYSADSNQHAGSGGGSGYCGGGSYGGEGGDGVYYAGGTTYGSIYEPDDLGSGGGYWAVDRFDNAGGGSIRLTVGTALTVTGSIYADGYTVTVDHNGGGSGGSVYIDTASMAGAGGITANGGTALNSNYAGGGGGRIAIYYDSTTYSGTPTVYGGYNTGSARFGGAGTIYVEEHDNPDDDGILTIKNNSHDYTSDTRYYGKTPLPTDISPYTFETVTIANDGHLDLVSGLTINYTTLTWTGGNISDNGGSLSTVTSGAVVVPDDSYLYANTARSVTSLTINEVLSHWNNTNVESYKIDYTTSGAINVATGAEVNVNGRGFSGGYGDGAGNGGGSGWCGGGSYGGEGGDGVYYTGGATNGLIKTPTKIGSGGGVWSTRNGRGGGAVKLTAGTTLTLTGPVYANGLAMTVDHDGAGSGGSIYLVADTIEGAGGITANGGTSLNSSYADGGGGRVAIYYDTDNFSSTITAYGGYNTGSARFGGAGTIYIKDETTVTDTLLIDNNSHDYTVSDYWLGKTPVTSDSYNTCTISNDGHIVLSAGVTLTCGTLNWTGGNITDNSGVLSGVTNGAVVIPAGSYLYANTAKTGGAILTSLEVNGVLSHSKNSTLETYKIDIATTSDITIGATGSVNVDGRGFNGGYGDGHGHDAGSYGSGGGYGGRGGNTSDGGDTGGATYGSATAPSNIGSGGKGEAASNYGSSGGGAIKLFAGGNMSVGGAMSANGGTDYSGWDWAWGGGSGGSIWLDATGALSGSSNLSANGSNARMGNAGAGGGGRIYAIAGTSTYLGSMSVTTATTGYAGESGTASLVQRTVPDAPAISNPLDNSYNNSLTPVITSSTYSDNGLGQDSSDWKIVASTDTCDDAAIWESEHDAVNLTSITVGTSLSYNTTYKACVRYTNSAGDSDWDYITITTEYNYPSSDATWHFNEAVVGDNYDYNDTYAELDASGNSLARLKDQGAGVYKGAPLLDYPKRKTMMVSNTTASELTNYQVKFDVLYDADMQADFDDIRFTSSDGTTLLDYWIETKTDSTSATIWLEVPTIPASSFATIYMYYGYASAAAYSDISNTFVFGDDFDDGSIDLALWQSGTGFTESSGYLNGGNTDYQLKSVGTFTGNYILETRHYVTTEASNGHMIGGWWGSASNGYNLLFHPTNLPHSWNDGAYTRADWTYMTNWIRVKMTAIGTGSTIYMYNEGTTSAQTITNNNGGLSAEYIMLGERPDGYASQSYTANWDWIFVRKYAATEPTTAWVGEASANAALADWNYRQSYSIVNNTASELTNYQVKITLPYDSDMQADFDDIRFTSSDGTTLLDYWLDNKTDSSLAYFWVEVPTIPASSTATFYLYYGNNTATSLSSVADTFIREISGNTSSLLMEEGSGTSLVDQSGSSHSGTLAGIPAWQTAANCHSGTCIAFDGSDDNIDMGSWLDYQTFSISLWVRPGATQNTYADIFDNNHDASHNFVMQQDGGTTNRYGFNGITGTFDLTASNWQHIVAIKDTTGSWVYVNGSLVGSGGASTISFSGQYLRFGRWGGGGRWWTGRMDEINVYTGMLTADERADLYQNTSYSTSSYPGKTLIREYAFPEPTLIPDETETSRFFSEITVSPSLAGTHPTFGTLLGLSATDGNMEGLVVYNISNDGTNWYYHDGTSWEAVTSIASQYNTIAEVNAYLPTFATDVGTGDFYFKAFLISDTTEEVELDSITLEYDATANAPTLTMSDSTRTPAMSGSAYSGYGEHQSSDWTISTSNSCVSNIVWSKDNDAVNKTSITANSTNGTFSGALAGKTRLTANTSYYACVRYASPGGDSDWSTPVNFTSAANNVPSTPTNSLPTNGATDQSKNATLTASAFSDSDSDPHTYSDWYVYESSDCSGSAIWSAVDTATNLASIDIDGTDGSFLDSHLGKTNLKGHTQYSFKVRYSDDQTSGDSSYSSCTNFTTLNTSPALDSSIPTQNLTEDVNTPNAFDLDTYFSDADWNDNDLYTCTATNDLSAALGTMTINGDQTIDFTLLANATGTDTIQFSCEDLGSASTASNSITVNVANVNDAPTFAGSPTVAAWNEDTDKNLAFDLDTYFTDIDPGDSCTYTVPTDPANITVNIDGDNEVSFSPDANYNGSQTVKFRCTDVGLATVDSGDISLTVNPVNDTPIANAGSNQNVNEDAATVTLDGSGSSDVDTGDVITYQWVETLDASDACSLTGSTTINPSVAIINKSSNYACRYSLEVNDGTVTSAADDMLIEVAADNDAPSFVSIDEKTIGTGSHLTFSVGANDVDTSSLTLSALDTTNDYSNIGVDIATLFTDNGNNTGTFAWTPTLDQAGTYTTTFQASDSDNNVTQVLNITVIETNIAPMFAGSLDNVSFIAGTTTPVVFDLDDYFSDPNGDLLTYSVAGNQDVTANINDNGEVTFTADASYEGSEDMRFIAADPDGATAESNEMIVSVTAAEDGNTEDQEVNYCTGTNRGRGIVNLYTEDNVLITTFQAFPVGGVIPRLAEIKNHMYVFAVKKRAGSSIRAYDIDGNFITAKRLSPKLHWRKMSVGNLNTTKNTEEIVVASKRGASIYLKVYSFNTDDNKFHLQKRSMFRYVRQDYRLQIENKNVIIVLNDKGKEVFRWTPFE